MPDAPQDISLLSILRDGGYSASVITTYNAWMPFYEQVVLRRLQAAGVQYNVVLMDQRQCGIALHQSPPQRAGNDYTLVPVPARLFHPKLMVLVGEKKARILIGSHNLTLSGFGLNWEITTRLDPKDAALKPTLQAAWAWLRRNLSDLPEPLSAALDAVEGLAPAWLRDAPPARTNFLGGWPGEPALWDQLRPRLPQTAKKIVVVGPFFDNGLRFLKQLNTDLKPETFTVGIAPADSMIRTDAAEVLPDVRFVDLSEARFSDRTEARLHGKLVWIQEADGTEHLITGSANPSGPAWLDGDNRNVEAVLYQTGTGLGGPLRLSQLADLPVVSAGVWSHMAANPPTMPGGAGASALIAFATEDGLWLPNPPGTPQAATLLSDSSDPIGSLEPVEGEGGWHLRGAVPTTAVLLVVTIGGKPIRAILHRPDQVQRNARGHRQRKLQQALAALNHGQPDLLGLISVVEDVLFAPGEPTTDTVPITTRTRESRAAPTGKSLVAPAAPYRNRNHEEDYILDALLQRIHHPEDDDIYMGLSEESLVGTEDEALLRTSSSQPLATAKTLPLARWHRKLGLLTERLIGATGDKTRSPEHRMIRVAAVLSLFHRLKMRELDTTWIAPGTQLVPRKLLQNLYVGLLPLLLKRGGPLLATPDRRPITLAMLQWLAFEQRHHRQKEAFEAWTGQHKLLSTLLDTPEATDLTVRVFEMVTPPEQLGERMALWAQTLSWHAALANIGDEAALSRAACPGDLARPVRLPDAPLRPVVNVDSGKAYLSNPFDPQGRGHTPFTVGSLRVFEAPPDVPAHLIPFA